MQRRTFLWCRSLFQVGTMWWRRLVSPQSGDWFKLDAPSGGVRLTPQALGSDSRPFCLLTQSPLFCLFCSCVGSHGCGYGCHAPVMGFASGLCLSPFCHDQSGPDEGAGLSEPVDMTDRSLLATTSMVSRAAGAVVGTSSSSFIPVGLSAAAARQEVSPKPVHASSSCVETLQRFARASGFSRSVARQLGKTRRASSVANYQLKWLMYRRWCADKGRSVSNPLAAKVADCLWLWEAQGLSLSSVKTHRSMLSMVFRFKLPELGEHRVLRDLLRSFSIERPCRPQVPPSWDLDAVLRFDVKG